MEDLNGLHLNRDLSHFCSPSELKPKDGTFSDSSDSQKCYNSMENQQNETEITYLSSHLHRYRSRTSFARQLSNSDICRRRRESFAAVNSTNLSSSGSGLNVLSGLFDMIDLFIILLFDLVNRSLICLWIMTILN